MLLTAISKKKVKLLGAVILQELLPRVQILLLLLLDVCILQVAVEEPQPHQALALALEQAHQARALELELEPEQEQAQQFQEALLVHFLVLRLQVASTTQTAVVVGASVKVQACFTL